MSREQLTEEENYLFNFIQTEFPGFKKNLKNNFLNYLVKSIASRIYSLKRVSDNYIKQLTNIDDGDLDYRASFYNITRLQAKKSSGALVFTGLQGSEIPQNSYFIDGNYTNPSSGLITNLQYTGIITIINNVGSVVSTNLNELPSGTTITIKINNITYNDVVIFEATESGFKININIPNNTFSCNYNINAVFIKVEAIKEGLDYNLDGNLNFNINQIIDGVNDTAYTTPQGITGGDDIESDERLKMRWSLYRTGYISNFSEDFIKIFLLENFSSITRIFVQRATPTAGNVSIFPLFENRENILPSFFEKEDIKNKLLEISPVSVGEPNILIKEAIKIPININFGSVIPNTGAMNNAILDSLKLYFKSQNGVGIDFSKNNLLLYLLANTIDKNNEKLISINLIATDTSIDNDSIAVLGDVNA